MPGTTAQFLGLSACGQCVRCPPGAENFEVAGVGVAGGEAQALVDVVLGGFGQTGAPDWSFLRGF
ncbi:MAG: hypothetical protein Q7U33_01195 [Methylotenera sp.]|uniref:hypothetical protein n=1 Tax=Methylotenera sp. TaxID=2051956 RepID=UPI002725D474|nr:hypothetical protein [Methylotenera sp.]MDO9149975.1 hypothetical protein [Methylotenera sp.]